MENIPVREFYYQQNLKFRTGLDQTRKRARLVAFARLITMVLAVWSLIRGIKMDSWIFFLLAGISLVLFFILISYHKNLNDFRKKMQILVDITEHEMKSLDGDFSNFRNGKKYLDLDHEFTFDLDIFGEKSLFQFLNRCCTKAGERLLAEEIKHAPLHETMIKETRDRITELSQKPDLLLDYRATGLLTDDSEEEQQEIINWSENTTFNLPLISRIFIYIPVILNIIILLSSPFISGMINYLILTAIAGWFFYGLYIVKINRYHISITRKQDIINKYLDLSNVLAHSDLGKGKLAAFKNTSEMSLNLLKKLDRLMNFLDSRLNLLVGVILNTLFLLDFHVILAMEKWKKTYSSNLADLFRTHAEFDRLVSKSYFVLNNPGFTWPEISEEPLIAMDLGHPLIQKDNRVCNDIHITPDEKVLIITGANMAGKSTFLRTIGVNLILAATGLKVCASKMKFKPEKIITGMRTTDSLAESESYFFAELKRLQRIVAGLENGESYFVLLDEILKGTNSTDKHTGSEALIKKLVHKKATILVATHDLKLGELEKSFPGSVRNYHFESLIEHDELKFDYKLRKGIAVNMNATFLMRKMGITG